MANINEIAALAGVSKATVSNVFTQKKYVSPEVTKKIMEICDRLNYRPSLLASGLATRKTNIIGLFLGNRRNEYYHFYGDLIRAVAMKGDEFGVRPMIYVNMDDPEKMKRMLTSNAEPIDGAIVLTPAEHDFRIDELQKDRIPFVLIGNPGEGHDSRIPYVDVDNELTTEEMTTYLTQRGHRRIILVNSQSNLTISNDRLTGYLKALRKVDIDFDPTLVFNGQNNTESGRQVAQLILRRSLGATAIVVESDLTAQGLFEVFAGMGIRIPEDMSVVSLGGDSAYLSLTPTLTAALQDYAQLGETAVAALNDLLSGAPVSGQYAMIRSRLFEGASCKDV